MDSDDSPDLHRFWIEFDIPTSEHPDPPTSGTISVDGGSRRYRMLSRGVGVTGYDLEDCLGMVREALKEGLPPITAVVTDPDLSGPEWDSRLTGSGSPVWRSIWFPLNRDQLRHL